MDVFAQLTMDIQIRPRAEFRNGFKSPNLESSDPAFFIEQRSRVTTTYQEDKFKIRFALQDVRIWGTVDQIYKDDPANLISSVFEAWGQYFINDKFSFKVGRMPISYNNQRFMGGLDWASQGRSHDAAMFKYEDKDAKLKIDLTGAFNQRGVEPKLLQSTYYPTSGNYKSMLFLWLNKGFENTNITALIHNSGYQIPSDQSVPEPENEVANRQTYAVYVDQKGDKIDFGAEAYYQAGENLAKVDINAYMFSGYVTYKTDLTPITLAVDYLSGTAIDDTEDKSFNPLFGTNHKFYGFMDYFYVGNGHGQNGAMTSGLIDIYLQTKFKLGKKTFLKANLHHFLSPVKLVDMAEATMTTEISKTLGTEIDLVFMAKLDKSVDLSFGYSQMFTTASLEQIKGNKGGYASMNNWAWIMLNFKPRILNIEMTK
jgi:hypothetical protein